MSDLDTVRRLQSAGYGPSEIRRLLRVMAGRKISLRFERTWRQTDEARALLADGRTVAEVVEALRCRFGISTATAYRRIAAAFSKSRTV